jgi:hypothetical protein
MSTLNIFVFAWALGLLIPCICRLDPLHYREHKTLPVLFYVALQCGCIGAMWSAYRGVSGVVEISALSTASVWMIGTYAKFTTSMLPAMRRTGEPRRRVSDRIDGALARRNGGAS